MRVRLFTSLALALSTPLAVACGGSPSEAPDAATPPDAFVATDAFVPPSDAGTDAAEPPDAGPPPPGDVIAMELCVPASLALDSDGSNVAYARCSGSTVTLVIEPSAGGTEVELGDAIAATPIWMAPDDAHVAWRDATSTQLRDVGGTAAATTLGTGTVEDLRFAVQTDTDQLRVLVLDRLAGGGASILAYDRSASGYDAPRTLVGDQPLSGDLELITSGARNVLFEVGVGGGESRYGMAQLDGAASAATLDVDPATFVMGVIGLGNTHGIARRGDGLAFVQFSDGVAVELVASGLPAGDDYPLFVVDDASMNRYAYFLVDGDPSRRLRNGTGPLETLAAGTGTGMALSPAADRLFFVRATELRSVTLDGATEAVVIASLGAPASFAAAISSDGALVAALGASGSLHRAAADGSGEVELDPSGVAGASIGWNGDDSALYWIRAGELRTAAEAETAASTIATDVVGWWALPGTDAVLYLTSDGVLRRL